MITVHVVSQVSSIMLGSRDSPNPEFYNPQSWWFVDVSPFPKSFRFQSLVFGGVWQFGSLFLHFFSELRHFFSRYQLGKCYANVPNVNG